ncbi:DUF1574 domain-containing protein [Aerosakkonema sp. BLCC-F183]|uniref:DUF1574 domain-containing protein n=1 Tax=Aerosakkonema sp. BLCC-F183 TaxID=3342834 RepID=UPI0035B84A36
MVKVNERKLANNASTLEQWVNRAIRIAGMQVRVRIRGNKLHILCEGRECPDRQTTVTQLVLAMSAANIDDLLAGERPKLAQAFLYGRKLGEKRPDWTEPIDLNHLNRYLEAHSRKASVPEAGLTSSVRKMTDISIEDSLTSQEILSERMAEVVEAAASSQSLARRGHPEAIARVLGENLQSLGVRVKVVSRSLRKNHGNLSPGTANSSVKERRLWVFCESAYSPDRSLLASPIAQKLRDLHLEGFRDAVIISQVSGEETPDWMLRVDLTPPEQMLREWAAWGDEEAIARWLDGATEHLHMEVSAVLKESTLHISCTGKNKSASVTTDNIPLPNKQSAINAIASLLHSLAPRGIQAAIIYGNPSDSASPAWVDWLNLPAASQPELATSAQDLAAAGDEEAIEFLLGRMLNPDLDWRLADGGIRVQARRKEDLLHIMTDGAVCPVQRQVAGPTANFVRELEIPGISGVRVYGRRAGQKQPLWNYGVDFTSRHRQAEEIAPEFATSDEYVEEVTTDNLNLGNSLGARLSDVTVATEAKAVSQSVSKSAENKLGRSWQSKKQALFDALVRSQIFTPGVQTQNLISLPGQASYQGVKVALVWGAVGIMLTWSVDLVLGQMLKNREIQLKESLVLSQKSLVKDTEETSDEEAQKATNTAANSLKLPQVSLKQTPTQNTKVFNSSGFTKLDSTAASVDTVESTTSFTNLPSPNPSFNNRQLDEKLTLYQQRVAQKGPPDILIVGSSRALRGVDPQALQKALAAEGYGKLEVFNFGVNGATAQVVDMLLRRCLTPEQLPKMIIWADGARAFNSGRVDATYNALAASPAYKQLVSGTLPRQNFLDGQAAQNLEPFTATSSLPGASGQMFINSQAIDEWLNQSLGIISSTYQQRDRLQGMLREQFADTLSFGANDRHQQASPILFQNAIAWDGFLPLTLRFNPTTYYEKHTKVTGEHDNDYKSFQLAGNQTSALESFLQFTQANQIPVVVINLPLTKEYLDPLRTKYEQEFQMSMLRLSLSRGFIFRNWSQLWPSRHDYFSDPSHLNRYGATAVSERLAQDPLIPWPKK